ncbi:hypothetical protein VULLAG_LOCUS21679 [Vulpes lagopus]
MVVVTGRERTALRFGPASQRYVVKIKGSCVGGLH